jgi:hypothetical protein
MDAILGVVVSFLFWCYIPREFIDKIAYCISTTRSAFCSRAVSPPSNFHGGIRRTQSDRLHQTATVLRRKGKGLLPSIFKQPSPPSPPKTHLSALTISLQPVTCTPCYLPHISLSSPGSSPPDRAVRTAASSAPMPSRPCVLHHPPSCCITTAPFEPPAMCVEHRG